VVGILRAKMNEQTMKQVGKMKDGTPEVNLATVLCQQARTENEMSASSYIHDPMGKRAAVDRYTSL